MNFINRMEQKFGRYALRDLPAIIIGLYAAGYVLSVIAPRVLAYLTLDPVYSLHGQVWRLVTWIIVPPSSLDIFTVIMLFFYFSIARAPVMRWGAFRFNFYFFSGIQRCLNAGFEPNIHTRTLSFWLFMYIKNFQNHEFQRVSILFTFVYN